MSTPSLHARVPPSKPLIAILGPTGTGKSNLAVSLATSPLSPLAQKSEIINADALQLYSGLPIATNQIPLSEQQGVPHHLLGCVPLTERPWTVQKYLAEARRVIDDVRSRGKIPIVVGGTGYYLQALSLGGATVGVDEGGTAVEDGDGIEFGNGQDGSAVNRKKGGNLSAEEEETRWPILGRSAEVMMEELRRVDPFMARKWHPNDRRKIRRSLAIWLQMGRKASEIYAEQKRKLGHIEGEYGKMERGSKAEDDASTAEIEGAEEVEDSNSSLLSPEGTRDDVLFFYLHAPSSSLDDRLEKRIENMLTRGLLDEIRHLRFLHDELIRAGSSPDLTRGIWIAIGYKEFAPYLNALEGSEASAKKRNCDAVAATGTTDSTATNDNTCSKVSQANRIESLHPRQDVKPNKSSPPYGSPSPQHQAEPPSPRTPDQDAISLLRKRGIERMVTTTRQYARSQRKWLRGQLRSAFLQHTGSLEHLFILDASSPPSFPTDVCGKAFDIVSRFLKAEDLPTQEEIFEEGKKVLGDGGGDAAEGREPRKCEVCEVVVMREEEWVRHRRSSKHKRAVKRRKREKERGERQWHLGVRLKKNGEGGEEKEIGSEDGVSGVESGEVIGLGGMEVNGERAESGNEDGTVKEEETVSNR